MDNPVTPNKKLKPEKPPKQITIVRQLNAHEDEYLAWQEGKKKFRIVPVALWTSSSTIMSMKESDFDALPAPKDALSQLELKQIADNLGERLTRKMWNAGKWDSNGLSESEQLLMVVVTGNIATDIVRKVISER